MLQNVRKRKTRAKHIYKTALSVKAKTLPTTQLCLWFLLLCTVVVLTLTPIFGARKPQVDAGQSNEGTQFTNAPWVQVNGGNALFVRDTSGNCSINGETLYDLLLQVNKSQVWNGYKTETSTNNSAISAGQNVYYLSAKNFGKLNDGSASANGGTANANASGNAQLQVKLFNGAALNNSNINSASTVLWQAVYRSMGSTGDVLTLYMNDIYCDNVCFDNTSPHYGYYGGSNLREVVNSTYNALKSMYSILDNYIVAPQNIPGLWQSSAYQTGSDKSQTSYTSGASLAGIGSDCDSINNGLDGLTNNTEGTQKVLHSDWTSTAATTNTYSDKLWVPSNYEAMYKDNTVDGDVSWVNSSGIDGGVNYFPNAGLNNATSGAYSDGRSGLWELNGYDRACSWMAWLRSGYSNHSDSARGVYTSGGYYGGQASIANVGARAALHLNLGSLASQTLTKISPSMNVSLGGSNSSPIISGYDQTLQTVQPAFNYSNYVIPNSTDTSKGKRKITFGAGSTTINSFTLQQGSTSRTINISRTGGNGTKESTGLCDYSYTYTNGQLVITISDVSSTGTLNVQANLNVSDPILNLKVTNSAPNSLLVLALMNGTTKLGEYGFVYSGGEQTVSITLPKNATIKILATKPFGSRVRFVLDGTDLNPTGVTSYQVSSGSSDVQNLVVTLTGDGSWSNSIVI